MDRKHDYPSLTAKFTSKRVDKTYEHSTENSEQEFNTEEKEKGMQLDYILCLKENPGKRVSLSKTY